MKYSSITFSRILDQELNKIHAIKGIRSFVSMGLKESKDLVEDLVNGPCNIKLTHEIINADVVLGQNHLDGSGVRAQFIVTNNKIRNAIGRQIEGTATWSTIAGQYDLAKELITLLSKYFPEGIVPDADVEETEESNGLA